MKVMYFLFEGFDTTNGTNHLALTTMQELLDNGMEVYLVTSHSKGIFPDIPDAIAGKNGFSYSVVQRNPVEKRNFVQRYIDGVLYAKKAYREWKKYSDEIDAVLLQSTPTAFFSAYLLHRHLKKPIVYNCFDVFPDGPFLFGAITNKALFTVLALMQSFVYQTSSKIVVISDDMKRTFLKKGISDLKLVAIPNWYDSSAVYEVPKLRNRFIKQYHVDTGKFIVQYAGNFGYTFHYRAVVQVAKRLKNHPEIEFHMIGTGGFERDFKQEAKAAGLTNIRFFPWQDADMVNDVYSCCSLEFVPLSKGVIWTSFPSKCTILMACGRTFLCMCETTSAFYHFVNQSHIGTCTAVDDYKSAAEQILWLSKNKSRLKAMESNARECAKNNYSSAANAPKYRELFKELTGG